MIRYEDLVARPEDHAQTLCAFLDLYFEPSLLTPYDGNKARMLGGLGDPNILQHSAIDPALAERWRLAQPPRALSAAAVEVAAQLGYSLHESTEPSGPVDPAAALSSLLADAPDDAADQAWDTLYDDD